VRSSSKFFVAIAVVVAVGALLGCGSAGKLSHQRQARLSTTAPSGRSQLTGDLEPQSFARLRLFHESPADLAGGAVRISSFGLESVHFFHDSFARRTLPVPLPLYQRPPPV
jgi:hypothetical protein